MVNSHTFSTHQIFLIKCRSGNIIANAGKEELSDMFNKIVAYTGKRYSSENEAGKDMLLFINMIRTTWPKKFVKEILGSYFLALKEKLENIDGDIIKLYPIIDIRSCSELLNSFDRHFKTSFESEIRSQKFFYEDEPQNKVTEEEINKSFINGLKQALEIVSNGLPYNVAGTDIFIYGELKKRGLINIAQDRQDEEIKSAMNVHKSNLNFEKYDPNTSLGRRQSITKLIESILPTEVAVINIAKRKILNDFLNDWVSMGFGIKEILG